MSEAIRVLLADDHQILREGLRALLNGQKDMRVVAEAGTGAEVLRLAGEVAFDVAVLDLGMPDMNGLDVIREIRQRELPIKIVVLSMHSGREFVTQAMELGSDGYVPKSSAHIDLVQAIRVVHSGQRFLHPVAATAMVDKMVNDQYSAKMLHLLSEREQEVLKLTALGFTSREIGEQLSLSPKTIDTYRERVMEKLDLKHRADIVQFALNAGLLSQD